MSCSRHCLAAALVVVTDPDVSWMEHHHQYHHPDTTLQSASLCNRRHAHNHSHSHHRTTVTATATGCALGSLPNLPSSQ